jgi:UDP-glucose 4-epimerase
MAVLVTGGAGYVGSVTVELLRARGQRVVVIDDLSRGHREAVHTDVPFYKGKVGDAALITQIVRRHQVEACIHFAALAYVGESVCEPAQYFENNVSQGIQLVNTLLRCNVRQLVFSSTCATYGEPNVVPICESHPQQPTNPYGWSKFFMERVFESYRDPYGLRFVGLRYFNAAGASLTHGESHSPEPHLIPNVLAVALGRQPHVAVFGHDYPTPDGTAIRDFIHVEDLGSAHILSLEYLRRGGQSEFINLGNNRGYSVLEVINSAQRVTSTAIETQFQPRRPGDPARLVANADKARAVLGWQPAYPDLEYIIGTAWRWHMEHPAGYSLRSGTQPRLPLAKKTARVASHPL